MEINVIRRWLHELPTWLKSVFTATNRDMIRFENGSKIFGMSDIRYSRGTRATLIFADNVAYLTHAQQYELLEYSHIVSSYSCKSILTSTLADPHGCPFSDLWHRQYDDHLFNNTPLYNVAYLPWSVHTEMDGSFKGKMLDMMGVEQWETQFECMIS